MRKTANPGLMVFLNKRMIELLKLLLGARLCRFDKDVTKEGLPTEGVAVVDGDEMVVDARDPPHKPPA